MQKLTGIGLAVVAALLAGCAAAPDTTSANAGPAAGTTPVAPAPAASGLPFLSIIGTPFLIAFKIPVCAATVAIAAPLAGLSEVSPAPNTQGGDMRRQLEHGVNQNCGPPWVVTP